MMRDLLEFRNKGFSLMEVMVTIVIIGILAAIALPNFSFSIERSKLSEGINILDALRNAQIAHDYEFNAYETVVGDLDVTITNAKHFGGFEVFNPADTAANPVARVKRMEGGNEYYRLEGFVNGDVTCSDNDVGTSKNGWCAKMGF